MTQWHPLYLHTDAERNALITRSGFEPLPHRSLECNPYVNANRQDFLRLTPGEIERVNELEVEIGKLARQADGSVWIRHGNNIVL